MSLIITAARRAMMRMSSASSPLSSSRLVLRAYLSTKAQDIPHMTQADQVSPKLEMISGYMEHLDRVKDNTDKIHASLQELKKEHEERSSKNVSTTVKWMDASDIDHFFVRTKEQQQAIEKELANLRQMMEDAKRTFAVDAPDGETDWHMKEEMDEITHIIDDQALLEDAEAVEKQHQKEAAEQREAAKIFAVDAPDGDVDDAIHVKEELEEINHIIDDQAVLEDAAAVEKQHRMEAEDAREAAKVFAVDAPDGDIDDEIHGKEEMEEINHIIEDQAKLEDAVEVEKLHQKDAENQREAQKIFAVDAPDGRSDGFIKEEIEEVKHIIEDQAYPNSGRHP